MISFAHPLIVMGEGLALEHTDSIDSEFYFAPFGDRDGIRSTKDPEKAEAVAHVLHRTPMLVSAIDRSHRVLIWNQKCEKATGYPSRELLDDRHPFKKLFPDRTYRQHLLETWRRHHYEFSQYDTWITCKDGQQKKIEWTGTKQPLPLPDFKFLLFGFDRTVHPDSQFQKRTALDRPIPPQPRSGLSFREHLLSRIKKMETMVQELVHTNQALSQLSCNIENEKAENQKQIEVRLRCDILPTIDALRRNRDGAGNKAMVERLKGQLKGLTASCKRTMKPPFLSLSSAEFQIATLIICGLSSQEIAQRLSVSVHTVMTHRKSIRKKLNLHHNTMDLGNFLRQLT